MRVLDAHLILLRMCARMEKLGQCLKFLVHQDVRQIFSIDSQHLALRQQAVWMASKQRDEKPLCCYFLRGNCRQVDRDWVHHGRVAVQTAPVLNGAGSPLGVGTLMTGFRHVPHAITVQTAGRPCDPGSCCLCADTCSKVLPKASRLLGRHKGEHLWKWSEVQRQQHNLATKGPFSVLPYADPREAVTAAQHAASAVPQLPLSHQQARAAG